MIKRAQASNALFEGIDLSGVTPEQILNSKKLYNYIVESFAIAAEEGKTPDEVIDEGLFAAIVGGVAGATIGTSIMQAVCKVLGIDPNGTLGKLITSKLVLSAMGAQLGYNW